MKIYPVLGTLLCLLACSCQNQSERDIAVSDVTAPMADSTGIPSSSAAEEGKQDSAKFIRTADLRFKVHDVVASSYRIEDIVRKNRGYVAYTHLASSIENVDKTKVSKDSSLETTHYAVSNMITIRVPNTLLDSTLKEIGADVDFLDHRTIKADDVSIQYLGNQLGKRRYDGVRTKTVNNAKQKEVNTTEDITIYRQEMSDEYFIANKYLDRDINYSMVNIEIYQRPSIRRELIANEDNIEAYTPGLFTRMGDALVSGWHVLEDILVFFVRFWAVIALMVVAWLMGKRFVFKPSRVPPSV
jgi:hypothetical protein